MIVQAAVKKGTLFKAEYIQWEKRSKSETFENINIFKIGRRAHKDSTRIRRGTGKTCIIKKRKNKASPESP